MSAMQTWVGATHYEDAILLMIDVCDLRDEVFADIPDYVFESKQGMEYWLADRGFYTNIVGDYRYTATTVQARATEAMAAGNSNISQTLIENGQVLYDVEADATAKTITTASHKLASGARTFLSAAGQAVTAASVGITLGKVIDSTLYNLNPDFWDAAGMSTLDPSTWSSITNGADDAGSALFNFVFGIDPSTKATQGYVDEDTFAYMAWWLANQGAFNVSSTTIDTQPADAPTLQLPIYVYTSIPFIISSGSSTTDVTITGLYGDNMCIYYYISGSVVYRQFILATTTNPGSAYYYKMGNSTFNKSTLSYTYNNQTVYYIYVNTSSRVGTTPTVTTSATNSNQSAITSNANYTAWAMVYSTAVGPTIDGITDQSGATVPDPSTWTDMNTVKADLASTYPDLETNAITYPVYDPATQTYTQQKLWPVAIPSTTSMTDTQPTGGTDTSQQSQTVTSASTDTLKKLIMDVVTPISTGTTTTTTPPTGTGSTPTPGTITGSASALWTVYNPSHAQLNSLGAWLWSSNFIDQILKMWQDPMQGIISLHQIYATPSVSGTSNIKVGYLDSGVSANVITEQYTRFSCGSVNLYEHFGNVFDYHPYTSVNIYLPFIGIVPLDVGEVMRSSVTVEYVVDWFTGAIIAQISAARDGYNVLLYQHAGNGAVQYPLSQGQNMSIVSAVLGAASGAARGFSMAGAAGAVALGAAGGASGYVSSHPRIESRGSFGGNAGAMGIKTPYLIITRPQTYMPDGYANLIGNPDYLATSLGSLSGFVKCKAVHIENVPCTDTELDMIRRALLEGVLV